MLKSLVTSTAAVMFFAVGVALVPSNASAAAYQFSLTPLTTAGLNPPDPAVDFILVPGTGHVGFPGGPDQTWGETIPSPLSIGGWADFYLDGVSLTFEGTSVPGATNIFLQSSTPFYSLTGGPPFSLTFPDLTPANPTETVIMTNVGFLAIGAGNTDTLTVSLIPEPAGWAVAMVGLGALGFAARRRRGVANSAG